MRKRYIRSKYWKPDIITLQHVSKVSVLLYDDKLDATLRTILERKTKKSIDLLLGHKVHTAVVNPQTTPSVYRLINMYYMLDFTKTSTQRLVLVRYCLSSYMNLILEKISEF